MKTLKHTLTVLLIAFVSMNVNAQKTGCVVGDCENGFGKVKLSNENYYEGYFKNGLYDSIGELNMFGHTHVGHFKKGLRHGKGTYYIHTNEYLTQVGTWKNDNLNGLIKSYNKPFAGGKSFSECNYNNGVKEGIEKTYDKEGKLVSEIEYAKSKKNGFEKTYNKQGVLTKNVTWLENNRHGLYKTYDNNGILISAIKYKKGREIEDDKDNYYAQGCIKGTCKNGKSKLVIKNDEVGLEFYEGKFKNGKMSDNGTHYKYIVSEIETTYKGNFKNNLYHGKGTFTNAYGYKYNGEWKSGKKEGYGSAALKDYYTYSGNWKNDMKHGKGTYKDLKTNTIKEGNWINDEFQE